MKKNLKIRLTAALLCVLMLLSVSCTTQNPPAVTTSEPTTTESTPLEDETTSEKPDAILPTENGSEKILTQTIKLYSNAESVSEITAAYYEKFPEILLMDTDTLREAFLDGLLTTSVLYGRGYTYEETETTLTIYRPNGAYCEINFVSDEVYWDNFDLFNAARSDNMSDIIASQYVDDDGNSIYFKKTDSMEIAGLSISLDLAFLNIPLDIYEGKKYIPFQTFNDLFLAIHGVNFAYNSEDLYYAPGGAINPALEESYYSIGPKERSEALASFTANEMSLLMDLYYGLQDEHGVAVGFEFFLRHLGLWEDMTSTDAVASSTALGSFLLGYLADKHSAIITSSPYTGTKEGFDRNSLIVASSYLNYIRYSNEIKTVRETMMTEGVPGYQEVGNTAYVTFDNFTIDPSIRFRGYSEDSLQIVDTFGLIIYAHSMITRENSPVENVVLDISCNGGGAADAAVYVVAWMLGYCDLHLTNPVTNSFSTTSYKVDVNLDGVFDEKDSIADKNLYCLISPVSFSCGNLVPALLKESGKVTLLGGASGGGACAVQHACAADGTLFQISSPKRLSVVSNGAYYTIDRGVEPHYYFSKMESYFDREALTDYINELK